MTRILKILLLTMASLCLTVFAEPVESKNLNDGAIIKEPSIEFTQYKELREASPSSAVSILEYLTWYLREAKREGRSIEEHRVLEALEPLIVDSNPDVSFAALVALYELDKSIKPLLGKLETLASSESANQANRILALDCIYKSGDEDILLSLSKELADDTNLEVRLWATTFLVFCEEQEVEAAMPVLLEALRDPILQDSVVRVFAHLGEKARSAGPSLRILKRQMETARVDSDKLEQLVEVINIVEGRKPAWEPAPGL